MENSAAMDDDTETILVVYRVIASFGWRGRKPPHAFTNRTNAACSGFTLIEVLIVIFIVVALATIAMGSYAYYRERTKVTRAIADIRIMEKEILAYYEKTQTLPDDLGDLGRETLIDPWGNPYQYLNHDDPEDLGHRRKEHGQVPLNTDFDLYSVGKDGASQPPLTANASKDDVVRGHNGRYVQKGSDYF